MAETNFADRLFAAVEEKDSRVCVGLDPNLELLPDDLLAAHGHPAEAVVEFCTRICVAVAPYAPVVKLQAAYFEALGRAASNALWAVIAEARREGLLVMLDGKRNDIGSTASAYAQAYFGGETPVDALTVNPYLGSDGILPFLEAAQAVGSGVFVLVHTSNPSAAELQDLRIDDSSHRVYEHVGEEVRLMGASLRGERGYSALGAVVGATYPEQLAHLRRKLPGVPFLVPGYGAQGAGAAEVIGAFDDDRLGAIVNASRSLIFAYRQATEGESFATAAGEAARRMRDEINSALQS
ncbi:MAG: orotidine-5'-phosphate decarboxylase [candidate division WS1 bacterium]|nr:orotidine-5'-phosphate decarboxylase [candidate division WS1 bacterium]